MPFRFFSLGLLILTAIAGLNSSWQANGAEPAAPPADAGAATAKAGTATVKADAAIAKAGPVDGPLAAYIAKADASFEWQKRREADYGKGRYVELILTSQTWQGIVWKHQLFLYRPSKIAPGAQALLMIEGGVWKDSLADPAKEGEPLPSGAAALAAMSETMQTPVAVLRQVPQQPIFRGMVEDQAIAYTFVQYLTTRNNEWPLLLPMVKSAVRAMDAVQVFAKNHWQLEIKHFAVSGASKRGWTTWLTAAVDSRVNALAPMVIDTLNMSAQMKHQVVSFGAPSERLNDYTRLGLQAVLDTAPGKSLAAIVDPYSYRAQIKQPKLVILGTNDPYWPLDALNLYWDGLEGEKHILYVPNNGHGLRDATRVYGTIGALTRNAASGKPLPRLTWKFEEAKPAATRAGDGAVKHALTFSSDTPVKSMQIWTATSPTRDFRSATWKAQPMPRDAESKLENAYRGDLAAPASGFVAMFAEAEFAYDGTPYYLSTNVRIFAALK